MQERSGNDVELARKVLTKLGFLEDSRRTQLMERDVVSPQNSNLSLSSSRFDPESPVMSQNHQPTHVPIHLSAVPKPQPSASPLFISGLNPNAPEFRPLGSIPPLPPAKPSLLTGIFDPRSSLTDFNCQSISEISLTDDSSAPVFDKHEEYCSSSGVRFNQVLNDEIENGPYANGKGLIDTLREEGVISHITTSRPQPNLDQSAAIDLGIKPSDWLIFAPDRSLHITDTPHCYDRVTLLGIARTRGSKIYPKALDPSFFVVAKRRWNVGKWHAEAMRRPVSEEPLIDWI